jgi:hypothetical protein
MDSWPNKLPEAEEIFGARWGARLAADEVIEQSSWIVVEGDNALVISSEGAISNDGKNTSTRVSGGTPDAFYRIRNRVTTSTGRKPAKEVRLHIR